VEVADKNQKRATELVKDRECAPCELGDERLHTHARGRGKGPWHNCWGMGNGSRVSALERMSVPVLLLPALHALKMVRNHLPGINVQWLAQPCHNYGFETRDLMMRGRLF
jgi:hypothetical protein